MLHACVQRFDVTRNLEKFGILGVTKQTLICMARRRQPEPRVASLDGRTECGAEFTLLPPLRISAYVQAVADP
jgi:hypothetical protein